MIKKNFGLLILTPLFLLAAPVLVSAHSAHLNKSQALIYYNEACGMCAAYINNDLPKVLTQQGITEFVKKDYLNQRSNRPELNELMTELGVPLPLQSHIMTFIGDQYILAGHIPEQIIKDLFLPENSQKFKRLIVYQDEMHGSPTTYQVWAIPAWADDFAGEIRTYPIDAPIGQYLTDLEKNKDQLSLTKKVKNQFNKYQNLLPVVLVSGFLDGINPCAFAVLLFFIAFLFSLRRTRAAIWQMGLVYITAIYLAYLLIGFGLLKAILFTNSPHFMAQLGAWLVIGLGVINLIGQLFPRFPIKLRIPHNSKETIQKWVYKSTLPAAFILGFLVGLCTFPCSGGIYVAIIGLLAVKTTYWGGIGYLLLYNLMFVAPLIIILLLAANKVAVKHLTQWEQSESKTMRLISALTMLILGLLILIWLT
ncbi:MAG: cytochrome c biogenesis protein CcdA [Patescibacteria group bacterium]